MDIDTLLSGASRATCQVQIVADGALYGELMASWTRLEEQLHTASTNSPCLGEPSPARRIADEMASVRDQITQAQVTLTLQAMTPIDWSDLSLRQPAMRERADAEDDTSWQQAQREHLHSWYSWVCEVISGSIFDPKMTTEQAGRLIDLIGESQVDLLIRSAVGLNRGPKGVPFSRSASELTQS